FCDWYIEICKSRLNGDDEAAANTARSVLTYVFTNTLALLHPFMPFITEEIWQSMPHEDGEALMVTEWPKYKAEFDYSAREAEFEKIMAVIRAVRNRRAEMNVPPSKKAKVCIASPFAETFKLGTSYICRLAYASEVLTGDAFEEAGSVRIVTDAATIFMPMNELVDFEKELARLNKELEVANKDKAFFEGKLNNPGFVAKAPAAVVEQQRQSLAKVLDKIKMLNDSILEIEKTNK
ncbi:MAG: class I tRNA ligase family protein, partial [Oscillospiraceae bacterium]|nr:class I tRNA ligase family protein [Oscillospiraceae bacterium]